MVRARRSGGRPIRRVRRPRAARATARATAARPGRLRPRAWPGVTGSRAQPGDRARTPDGLASPRALAEDEELVAGRRPVEEAFAARRPRPSPARRPGATRRARPARPACHDAAHPGRGGRGRHPDRLSGFDGHQGVALVVEPASLGDARRRPGPGAGARRAALRARARLISRTPRTWARSCAAPRPAASTACSSRPGGAAPISPAAIKTSAGAVEHLLLVPMDDLPGGLVDLHATRRAHRGRGRATPR